MAWDCQGTSLKGLKGELAKWWKQGVRSRARALHDGAAAQLHAAVTRPGDVWLASSLLLATEVDFIL